MTTTSTDYYATVLNWPTVTRSGQVWLRVGDLVDALIIRTPFAARVNAILDQSLLPAPIIRTTETDPDWIFLTQPRVPLRPSTWQHLTRIRVRWPQPQWSVRLPPPDGCDAGICWVRPPVPGAELPPWTAVVAAARSAAPVSA